MDEEFGFPGCIGIGDGTNVQLAEQPWENGWSYWCWKKFYVLSALFVWLQQALVIYKNQFIIQAICDHQGIFLAYEFGWPGCISDAIVFKESTILVDLSIFLYTKVRSWFSVMAWVWSPMCSYPQYHIWPFSDYDLINDAAEAGSGNYGMSNCLTFEWLLKSIWMAQKPISLSHSSLWL